MSRRRRLNGPRWILATDSVSVTSTPKGFTLIELLVVVAIISLLVSILLPSLGRAKELARRSICASNLHSIMNSLGIYAAEEGDNRLPSPGPDYRWPQLLNRMYYPNGGYGSWGDRFANLGLLVETGICGTIGSDGVLRCPSNPPERNLASCHGDPDHPNYWLSARLGRWANRNAAYPRNWFPELEETPEEAPRLEDLPLGDALHSDAFRAGHEVINCHGDGVNVLYVAGNVLYVHDTPSRWLANLDRNYSYEPWSIDAVWGYLEGK